MERPVKKKQEIDLIIEDLGFRGKGIAKVDDYLIFVKNGVPGQKVKALIKKAKSSFGEAIILEVLEKSKKEIDAKCSYSPYCGGCKHQKLSYKEQLFYLHKQVQDLYQRLGSFKNFEVAEIIGADIIFNYRNKMEFSFSNHRWLTDDFEKEKPIDFALGLRAPGNFWKSIDLDDCLIAPKESGDIMKIVRNYALANNLTPYDQKKHTGFLRHLVIRKGENTNQVMVNIVTSKNKPELLQPIADILSQNIDNIKSIVNTVATNYSGTTIGDIQNSLYGKNYIEDKLGKLNYRISPASFFQTNTKMAEKLYDLIRKTANPQKDDVVWDLYCGTGSIALYLASAAKEVIGIEIVPDAIENAKQNAQNNGITNVRFFNGNLDKIFRQQPELLDSLPRPDILIIDPPRAGMHPKLLNNILQLNPSKIVYVSCNPSTQVRDLRILVDEGGYNLDSAQPVDMFPHTPHIEVVTGLSKKV